MTTALYWRLKRPDEGERLPIALKWAIEQGLLSSQPTCQELCGFYAALKISASRLGDDEKESLETLIDLMQCGKDVILEIR